MIGGVVLPRKVVQPMDPVGESFGYPRYDTAVQKRQIFESTVDDTSVPENRDDELSATEPCGKARLAALGDVGNSTVSEHINKGSDMSTTSGLLREIDRDVLRAAARTAAPFPHVLIDDFLEVDFAREVLRSWPSYADAARMGKEFRSINERNKVQVTDSDQFPPALQDLNSALASPEFIETVSTVFGIPKLLPDAELVGGGLHQTGPRGRLDVHVDFNYIEARKLHRRLNILIYFNEGWLPEWGGQLELWNRDVSKCVHSFDPGFNRCVIFETSEISYHGVSEVRCPRNAVRRSFAGYYYTEAAPAHWTGKSHTTVFKARPEELVKNQLMNVDRAKAAVKGQVKKLIRRSEPSR
jgi:Rps23 Pro-64 3,4-dihydroxylase Tpa1-like proline 4-hydroxylase